MKRATLVSALPLSVCLFGFAGTALAEAKIYTANICQLHSDSSDMGAFLQRSVFGGISNSHTSRFMTVVCPVVRDYTTNTSGLDQVKIWGVDRHPTERMECTVRATGPWGDNSISSTNVQWPVGANAQGDVMNLWAPVSSAEHDHTNSQYGSGYQINCKLPPRVGGTGSAISQFYVDEAD